LPNEALKRLAEELEEVLLNMLDEHMFYKEIEQQDQHQTHANDLNSFDDGRDITMSVIASVMRNGHTDKAQLAYRYRLIRQLYQRNDLSAMLQPAVLAKRNVLLEQIDRCCLEWLRTAHTVLSSLPTCNIVVSNGPLIPALGTLLLYGLGSYIPFTQVYSSARTSKRDIFDRILSQLPRRTRVVAVGASQQHHDAARALNLPFHLIQTPAHLQQLLPASPPMEAVHSSAAPAPATTVPPPFPPPQQQMHHAPPPPAQQLRSSHEQQYYMHMQQHQHPTPAVPPYSTSRRY